MSSITGDVSFFVELVPEAVLTGEPNVSCKLPYQQISLALRMAMIQLDSIFTSFDPIFIFSLLCITPIGSHEFIDIFRLISVCHFLRGVNLISLPASV